MLYSSTILSTKSLSPSQQELILNSGLGCVHYDVLKIEKLKPEIPKTASNLIVTSKNALHTLKGLGNQVTQAFCVGEKTAASIKELGLIPTLVCTNAQELAQQLTKSYSHLTFTYLCGDHRRDELPDLLSKQNIPVEEIIVYRSSTVNKSFDRIFAAVLFYSPRGVYAFAKANSQQPKYAICIGETTATAARELYSNVLVAKKQTVENVLVTAINVLRDDKK